MHSILSLRKGESIAASDMENTFISLYPGRSAHDFNNAFSNLVLLIGIFRSFYDNAFRWMPLDLADKSKLVHVVAWCCQATSHHLRQCWPRFKLPYGITRPHWVNPCDTEILLGKIKIHLLILSFLNIEMAHAVVILLDGRLGPVYHAQSIEWLLMAWRYKEQGHQQPWYWPSLSRIFWFQHHTS